MLSKALTLQKQPVPPIQPMRTSGHSHREMTSEKKSEKAGHPEPRGCGDGIPDRVISTSLGALHDGHPLVIVAEERQIKVGATAVRLGTDGELTQQPAYRLRVPSVLGVYNSVFKPKIKHQ